MSLFQNHTINNRILTTNTINCTIEPLKNYFFDLSYLGLIQLDGEKAVDFLQGQLTCDLNAVSDIQMIQGAQCNLKGRILSLMDVINWNGIKLILPQDMIEATAISLNKTAQLSRVTLKECNEFKIAGFYLQNSQDFVPDSDFFPSELYTLSYTSNYCYYHLGDGFYIFIVPQNEFINISELFKERDQYLGSMTWHTLRLMHKQIDIYPESRGLFLPHRLGLHETKYISFNKGCYKGQEIIARTQYRATIKHELKIFIINTDHTIYSGQKLFHFTDEIEIGELIDYSNLGNNRYLIAASMLKEPFVSVRFEGQNKEVRLEIPVL
ncbi:glycine cleavage T protein [Legionella moravica]|uniref:Glycine cleavage T protein n=1 Tax=Legionella moravica TaxID=39962 RepID=A0A378JVS7_9GAMM|nr:glycine cleavage system protein T [Legionella moravica]KTD35546.1 glycine cleavage T protein [Legionella moravica]STX62694.1 glycine cleavage T protein [Legionella moravica]